ncbi:MAG: efflux RND transporter periplasmic adaptor subunit [Planctomycetota bacterium]
MHRMQERRNAQRKEGAPTGYGSNSIQANRVFLAARGFLLVLASLTLVFYAGCGAEDEGVAVSSREKGEEKPVEVSAVTARAHAWPEVVKIQGSLYGDEEAVVGAKVQGRVDSVDAEMGSLVHQGQVLASLDPKDFKLKVQQAEALYRQVRARLGMKPDDSDDSLDPKRSPKVREEQALLEDAQSKAERAKYLLRQRAISTEEVQAQEAAKNVAEARYQSALNGVDEQIALLAVHRAELEMARTQLDESVLKAPFDGIVRERLVAPGVYVNVGDAIVVLVRTNPLRFRGGVPERDAMKVQIGQKVKVRVDGADRVLEGNVTRISPALDLSSRSLTVEIDLPNPESRFRAGLFAEAEITVDEKAKTLAIPAEALYEFAGIEKVWLIREGVAAETKIRAGRRNRSHVEVLEGLSTGDQIIAHAPQGRPGPVVVRDTEDEEFHDVAD